MSRIYFVYMLSEHPSEPPYYCKIGFTSQGPARFTALQEGNPRALKEWKYEARGIEYYGLPFPNRRDAQRFEHEFLRMLEEKGNRLARDYHFSRERSVAREWIQGVMPDKVWNQLKESYRNYIKTHHECSHFLNSLIS
ncbi:GIY-YIG nuclease family protein [Chromobacterium violaceum]|uniref:GIY-YIG nuclease family protein n=1 Tax=Chromobacterium violaceum TaxID=536 RepID=UPI0009BB4A2B|nr:GIY-YIG nuclease family protein [Chromobacterium violaceum]